MRLLLLLPLAPFVLQAAPPLALEDAAAQILEAFDEGRPRTRLPEVTVNPKDRPALAWLRATLYETNPQNPFPKTSAAYKEAESIRALLAKAPGDSSVPVTALKPTLAGSFAALWTWGQGCARKGLFSLAQRQAWEDLLASAKAPAVVRGWALRHALCFALAEGDETRLMTLKTAFSSELPDFFQPFQRAFSLLGGPSPRFYFWSLPDLQPQDLALSALGSRVYVAPPELPAPADAAWIIPAPVTNLPVEDSVLANESLAEATRIAEQVRGLGRKAWFAPSRQPLEALALVYFPIDIRLDARGMIQSIRMGDAAQAKPMP